MAKRTEAKLLKKLQQRFGKLAQSMEEYYHHLDFRDWNDFDDAAFAFVMAKVKGVTMLDLNETEISSTSIELLTHLDYVKEIRAKSCQNLDDSSIPFFSQIKELEFLHLKSSAVTLNGLLQLNPDLRLKTLLFSESMPLENLAKLQQLQNLFPDCELIINGQSILSFFPPKF